MSNPETLCDQPETDSEWQGTPEERIMRRLDHLDDQLHEIRQFIGKYTPALEKFTGSRLAGWMGGRHGS